MRRRDEVLVGILVTVAVIVGVIGTLWLARGGLSRGYPLYTRFAWGQNLKHGQPVLLAGVSVGYVGDVRLRPDGYLDVELRLQRRYQVPRNATSSVQPVGFFGDVAIALTPTGPSTEAFQPGDTVPAGPPAATVGEVLSRVDTIGESVTRLLRSMENEFVAEGGFRDMRRAMASAQQTMTSVQALTGRLSLIAAEQNRNLTATMDAFRRTAAAVDPAVVDSTLRNFQTTSANLAALTGELDETNERLNGLMARLERGEGTAGKLLSDTLLYADMRNTMRRVDSVLADFQRNPRRYINLSIF
jgi:phospholipid/cholesterol/gamma-HCH transport system substrate-binding protein